MSAIRTELIRRSLRAQAFAWVGLIPVLGLPFLTVSWIHTLICRRLQRTEWNPARRQLRIAVALQIIALLQTLFLVSRVAARFLPQF